MSTEPVTILSITIENFRGFQAEQTIDLGASATIVSGSNGKGKTSFFDAMQWLLLGSLGRLASLANRRSGDYIVNGFAGAGAQASVSATFYLGEQTVIVSRTGDHKQTQLRWQAGEQSLLGEAAEKALSDALLGDPQLSLRDTVLTSGVLQQDVVRAVLEDEPKNRYRHVATFLGLEEIAGFEDDARQQADEQGGLAKRLRADHAGAEQQLRAAEADLARLEQRLSDLPEVSSALTAMQVELAERAPAFEIQTLPAQSSEVVALAQVARHLRTTAERLSSDDVRLREQEANLPTIDQDELFNLREHEATIEREKAEAQTALEQARARQAAAQERATQLAELANLAIPLLGAHCPVCEQPITADDVEAHLRELIDAGGEDLPALARATAEAEQIVSRLEQDHLRIGDQLQAAQGARNQIESVAAERERWRRGCTELAAGGGPLRQASREAIERGDADALQALIGSSDQLAAISDRLATLFGASGIGDEVERQRGHVETLRARLTELAEQAATQSRRAEEAKTLAGAATRAIAGVTRDRFATLQPLVDDIFARLAPHPAFTTLGFEMGVSYRSGVADAFVRDPESGVTADPLLVFSSSQANVAALTYFLALSWAAEGKGLPFLLLDDPLQSMDDVNALGFSDLCRHIRKQRQLVVSTHERRLANLLERKLAPRSSEARTRVVRFTGWDREGPKIEQEDVDAEPVEYLLAAG